MADRLRGFCLATGLVLLLGSAGLFLIRYRVHTVPTRSMTPAIMPGDRIVVDTWSRTATRGDLVLATAPWESDQVVKRVTATEGDPVTCCDADGRMLVGGVALPGSERSGDRAFSVRVEAGRLFLTGDNQAVSRDSRSAASESSAVATVGSGSVSGRVVAVAFPVSRTGLLPDRAAGTLRAVTWAAAAGLILIVAAALLAALAASRPSSSRPSRPDRHPGPSRRG
ncbi:hypothetical protein ACTI_43010 [Actinoplanes sp. OR16]|uniref:signal peptidase I n=1 Tax=Actinoplanes sp. OR16 TaxID=946334 RepID=UPI000F6E03FD|nr:signal peptidase I [Actinoplanes sp. OR16]BBH67616.1 hypothetical protein ACTI_43010 [Actinoplanes sp. OR16]